MNEYAVSCVILE